MTTNDIIMQIYLDRSLYYYDFDLEDGIVKNDIIDYKGFNYTEALGLKSPCAFDELMERSYSKDFFGIWHVSEVKMVQLSQKELMKAYEEGQNLVEATFYLPNTDQYNRISYYLVPNEETGKPHVFVCCIDITAYEKSRKITYGDLISDKNEIDDIVASARIGIWHIYLYENEKPRLKVTPMMGKLLGISPEELTEEEMYEYWYYRIKRSSIPSVNESVQEMISSGFSENTYTWKHPEKGEIFVRCGGTATKVEGKGYILRGYHSDVTETVTSETRQKQLLADALDEVRRQKKLLQEALDDYKEADYDRRRDFLTGLRNRQDMFEMLQDVLSGKREQINAMYMMDIDNFKRLNDRYGHSYGDQCLQKIGAALNEYSKTNNIYFYRYGGEEILGICFDDKKQAAEIAEELVLIVANLEIERDDTPFGKVTVSLGYTTDNQRYEKMVDKADTAMYKAKEDGKNRAVCFEALS